MSADHESPNLVVEIKEEAKADARDYLRTGWVEDPDETALKVLFESAIDRVRVRMNINEGTLPDVVREQLRHDYDREFSRRMATRPVVGRS